MKWIVTGIAVAAMGVCLAVFLRTSGTSALDLPAEPASAKVRFTAGEELVRSHPVRRKESIATTAQVVTPRAQQLEEMDGPMRENVATQWAEKDFPAALAWASGQPAGEARDRIIARLAWVQSRTAPVTAAQLVANQIPAGARQTEAAISVLHQWANQDLPSALAWADQFPAGSLRERAFTELEGVIHHQVSDIAAVAAVAQ